MTLLSVTGPNVAEKFADAGHNAPADLVNFCFENVIVFPVFDAFPLTLAPCTSR